MSVQHPFILTASRSAEGSSSLSKPSSTGPRVFSITSGKGGVGKTSIAANLGVELAKLGHEVCIFDADTGLANINILLGLTPKFTLEHVLSGEKTINEIVLYGPGGVTIVPASSGISDCADLDARQRRKLISALRMLEEHFDYLLIDTAAGIHRSVLDFVQSTRDMVLVITPEPTSLTDAFAMLRVLKQDKFRQKVYVLVNTVANFVGSMEVFQRFADAVNKYLSIKVRYLGYIARDEAVPLSVKNQHPVVLAEPMAPASQCFQTLAQGFYRHFSGNPGANSFSKYWEKLIESKASETASADDPDSATTSTEKRVLTLAEIGHHLSVTFNEGAYGEQELTDFKRDISGLIGFDAKPEPVQVSWQSSEQPGSRLDEEILGLIDSIKYASLLGHVEDDRRDIPQKNPHKRRSPLASRRLELVDEAPSIPSQQEVNLRDAFRKMTDDAIKNHV